MAKCTSRNGFDNGPGYCRGCRESGLSCGNACPYRSHESLTEAGWQAWDVLLRIAGQLRFAPGGAVTGIDLGVAMHMAEALGYDVAAVADLLPDAEAGLLEGLKNQKAELARNNHVEVFNGKHQNGSASNQCQDTKGPPDLR